MQIETSELSKETREELGIELEPTLVQAGIRYIALCKVLKALNKLQDEDAHWVLSAARRALSKQGQVTSVVTTDNRYVPPLGFTIEVVARQFNVSVNDIKLRSRIPEIVEARQTAMYVLVMINEYTLEMIGKALGGRAPATISYGFQKIATKLGKSEELKNAVKLIETEIHQ